jgi:spore maturation protein CgeB
VISDIWDGLSDLLEPRREILLAQGTEDVIAALEGVSDSQARGIGEAARQRILAAHTAAHRAAELEGHLQEASTGRPAAALASVAG